MTRNFSTGPEGELVDCVCVALNPALDRTLSIPGFAAGRVNRVAAEEVRPGGKGVNVAATLAAEGFRVALAGFFGRVNLGPFETLCARSGIRAMLIPVEGETRTGLKIVDPTTRETTDINFPGATPDSANLQALVATLEGIPCRWVALAGSLPPGVPEGFYADLTRQFRKRGIEVALDTSGVAFRHALEARPTLIKPNIQELSEIVGRELSACGEVAKVAVDLVASGIALVAVSMGARGAVIADRAGAVLAHPPKIAIRSTVGAGDAMVAGLISARLRGLDIEQAARLATGFAARAISLEPLTPENLAEIRIERLL